MKGAGNDEKETRCSWRCVRRLTMGEIRPLFDLNTEHYKTAQSTVILRTSPQNLDTVSSAHSYKMYPVAHFKCAKVPPHPVLIKNK